MPKIKPPKITFFTHLKAPCLRIITTVWYMKFCNLGFYWKKVENIKIILCDNALM